MVLGPDSSLQRRDPLALLQRFGRQLLVDGVTPQTQAALADWAAVVTTDGSANAALAAEVVLRGLVGAGMRRVCAVGEALAPLVAADASDSMSLRSLDPALEIVADPARAHPPVAHLHLASRAYGGSVDFLLTEASLGWAEGAAQHAVVSTLICETGEALAVDDAPGLGSTAARLLTEHALGLRPLPAVLHLRWPDDGAAPTVEERAPSESGAEVASLADAALPPGLLAEVWATADVWQPIAAHVERDWPNEACGFVLRLADGSLEAVASRNLQDRYHGVDPESYPRTSRTAFKVDDRLLHRSLEQGAELALIYHSHCEAGAYFSAEDARAAAPDGEAMFPNASHVVVSVLGGVATAAALFHFDPMQRRFAAELGSGQLPEALRRADPTRG